MASFPEYKVVSLSSLIPYARNSRTHSDTQVAQIAASIKEFGFTNPVLIDETGGIIAGHGRVLAAQKLKLTEVPAIELSHLSDTQKRAYVIADNKLALNAGWDDEMLRVEFAELEALGFDLELTGFDPGEIEALSFDDLGNPSGEAGIGEGDQTDRTIDPEKYTTKIETPIYEIKGNRPNVSELFNNDKTGEISKKIMAADIPDDIRGFLMAAATRHTVFNYEKIAEFYAHADPETKELMEDSALVIVDYGKAIENGWVKLTKALIDLSATAEANYD